MRAVIQRVSSASVTVDGAVVGQIGVGFLVLLGVRRGDTRDDAAYLARKIAKLRVFNDSGAAATARVSSRQPRRTMVSACLKRFASCCATNR